ncbi:MAG: glycosyltransferase family 2 protein [Anaerolineales bacterium]|nr:glycosyltransferase family 2 protein [Anaerolineales bacterium]
MVPALTAVVLTRNEAQHLPDCLTSLAWAADVLVFDSFSTDKTVALAEAAGARVQQRAFDDYAGQRQAALEACQSEWVLFVDADERVTPALAAEIELARAGPEPAWWIPRHNYIFGRLTLHAGWYPDYQLRLLRRALARYDPARPVHELALLDSDLAPGRLQAPLIHLNYETIAEFVTKQRYYARHDASRLLAEGHRARPHNFILQPWRQFVWRWITLGGWRAGWHGLRLSALMAYFEWQKYAQLRRLQAEAWPLPAP